MAKKNLPRLNPLGNITKEGFIGYVPEEDESSALKIEEIPIDRILDSPFQTREQVQPAKFAQLVHSIKTLGFQGILLVRPHPEQQGYYQIVAGGHSRRDAAREAGNTTLPVVITEADERKTGIGTALENLGREDLNTIEKGKLFLLLRRTFNLSQEDLARELGEDISRNQIKECEAAATSAPDIQEMLAKKEGGGGIRAAKYLRQLDKLDEEEPGRATRERAPIIKAFLDEELSTDGVHAAVQGVLQGREKGHREAEEEQSISGSASSAETTERPVNTNQEIQEEISRPVSIPSSQEIQRETASSHQEIERTEKIENTMRRFRQFQRLLGSTSPSERERTVLQKLADEIQVLLERS